MGQSLTLSMFTPIYVHANPQSSEVEFTRQQDSISQKAVLATASACQPQAVLCSLAAISREKPLSAQAAAAQPCCKPQPKSLHAANNPSPAQ